MINYSFVIPHHNSPLELARCLDSIPQRSDIEIIVVDDNSDEDKHPVITRSDVRLISISKEESKGAGRARNYGLRVATGKWLLFADCDDFYEKDFLNVLDEYSTQDIDMFCFDVYFAYDLAKRTEKWKNRYSIAINKYLKDSTIINLRTVKHILNNPWNFMVRREIPISNDIWFEEIPKCNDAYFHHAVSMLCQKVAIIDKKLYYWVWSGNGITHRKKTREEMLENIKHSMMITGMRVSAQSWNAVPPLFEGFWTLFRLYGFFFILECFVIRLSGAPWLKIWWHQMLD